MNSSHVIRHEWAHVMVVILSVEMGWHWPRMEKLPMMSHALIMSVYLFDIFAVSLDSI